MNVPLLTMSSHQCSVNAEIPVIGIMWQGTAFDCPAANEIVVLTNRFDINISHSCNNRSIVGWNVVKPI